MKKAQYTASWHLDAISIDPEIQLSCKQAMMAKKEEEIRILFGVRDIKCLS